MLYELRTYTMRPGMAPQAAAHSADVGRAVRGDDYGKLEGYWLSEIGPLNQVMHLWSYADANARMAAKAALGENQAWRDDYLPKMRPMLVRQPNRADLGQRRHAVPCPGSICAGRGRHLRSVALCC